MLAYSRSQGLFAGVDISGGVLRPDKEADARAYGANATARDARRLGPHRVAGRGQDVRHFAQARGERNDRTEVKK